MGWRAGLQIIAGLCSISIFVGLLYRPASLYHPQRRAIQHLKNQRRKVGYNRFFSLYMYKLRLLIIIFMDLMAIFQYYHSFKCKNLLK